MDKLLRINEVSELLGIPVLTLRDWRAKGRGPKAAKFGQRLVYRQRDVERWVDEQFADASARSNGIAS